MYAYFFLKFFGNIFWVAISLQVLVLFVVMWGFCGVLFEMQDVPGNDDDVCGTFQDMSFFIWFSGNQ